MKRMLMITTLVIAAPFTYAENEMAKDTTVSVDARAESAVSIPADAVEVIDKGTQAVPVQQELLPTQTIEAAN